jgi:hypothetical protein
MTKKDPKAIPLPFPPSPAASANCAQEHAALKSSGEQWPALPFAGIQPLDRHLFECRQCPVCGSTVQRPVTLTRALELLFEDLLTVRPPRPTTARSASLLTHWVAETVQPALEASRSPTAKKETKHARSR